MRREGSSIGQFRLERLLGHGGMGTVYLAVDEMTGREVAIKLLRPEALDHADFVDRFKAEARTLARLDHARIARLFSFFEHGDDLVMVMEFVRGQTLASLIREGPAIPPATALRWTDDILDALHYAHSAGVVHRDIKPANILIDPNQRARLTDFGIARTLGDSHLTQTGQAVGTVAYMAPEQVMSSEVDGRTDLYATAVVLFEMLTGRIPYSATTTFTLMREVAAGVTPDVLDMLSPDADALRPVLARALSIDPEHRFADGNALRHALATAAHEMVPQVEATTEVVPLLTDAVPVEPVNVEAMTVPVDPPSIPPAESGHKPWPRTLLLFAALAIVAAIALVAILRQQSTPEAPAETPPVALVTPDGEQAGEPAADGNAQAAADVSAETSTTPAGAGASPEGAALAAASPARTPRAAIGEAGAERSARRAEVTATPDMPTPAEPAIAPDNEPARAEAPALPSTEFTRARMMMTEDEDTDDVEVILRFDDRRLTVVNADSRLPLKAVAYSAIVGATYSTVQSRLRLFRGPAHWLDINAGGEHVVLRLDRRNQEDILTALEKRSRVTVQRPARR